MKIATWNLDRPWKNGRHRRADLQLERILAIGADIWVLTETWDNTRIPGYQSAATPSSLGSYDESESAVAIWVPATWDMSPLNELTTTTTICAEVVPPDSDSPLLVYGTIITWRDDPRGKNWAKHLEETERQTDEWVRLRREFPSHRLIVAGDFNMTLHADKGYGHKDGRRMVRERLPLAGMNCVTAFDIRDAAHGPVKRDNIDHICIDTRLTLVGDPRAFAGTTVDDKQLSDHNGMEAEVTLGVASGQTVRRLL